MEFSVLLTSPADAAPIIEARSLAVIPIFVGPLQALLAILPGILVALGGMIVTMFKPSAMKRFVKLLWAQKFIVGAIVAAVWGLIYVYGVLFPPVIEDVSAAVGGADAKWALWRGSVQRRGFAPGPVEEPAHGSVVWSFSDAASTRFYSSPAVVGNRVFVTSATPGVYSEEGAVFCLDAESKAVVWAFRADGYKATFSSPSVSGKYLVVGEGLHFTKNARVFCLDVEESGKRREAVKLWSFETKSHVESSPCIADGRVVIGAGDDGLYCFALKPGPDGKAQRLWHLDGQEYPDCETSPVIHNGKVYFGLGLGGQGVVCVNAETGDFIWRKDTPYPVFGSPSIAGDTLLVGMGFGDFVNTAEQVATAKRAKLSKEGKSPEEIDAEVSRIKPGGEVWCLDLETGDRRWDYKVGRVVLGAVAVDGDRLYFGSRDKNLYCLSTDGKLKGAWNAHVPIITSPAVGNKHVYIVTVAGQLYGIDKRTLTPVWDVSLNSESFSSPAVGMGHVYVGTTTNGFMCVGQPGRETPRPIWRGELGGSGKAGSVDGSLMPSRGSYAWGVAAVTEGDDQDPTPVSVTAPPAYVADLEDPDNPKGAFYVGIDKQGAAGLARFDCGKTPAKKPTLAWIAPSKHPVHLSAAGTDTAVCFVDGKAGDAGRTLRCVDPKNGHTRWQRPVGPDAGGQFVMTYDRLIIADRATGLTCMDITSPGQATDVWRWDGGPSVGAPTVVGDILVVATASPASLCALDLASGIPLWEQTLTAPPRTPPVLSGGKLWIGTAYGVAGYDLLDGHKTHTVVCGSVVGGRLVGGGTHLAGATETGHMVVINTAEPATDDQPVVGHVVARIEKTLGGLPPVLTDDGLLYWTEGSLQRYDLASGQSQLWSRVTASWPGNLVTPMIMVDSHVVFGTDKKGLVCMKPKK